MSFNIGNIPYTASASCIRRKAGKTPAFQGQELNTPEIQQNLRLIDDEIKKANTIAVFTHKNPDEDSVGSAAALKNIIAQKYPGKKVDVLILNNLPEKYKYLEDSASFEFINSSTWPEIKTRKYDLAIAVDCREKSMMGEKCPIVFDAAKRKIKIDHHDGGKNYADISLVNENASSASQLILLLTESMGVKLDKPLAADIYSGIIGDTLGFRHMKKSADLFSDCSKLSQTGIDTKNIYSLSMDFMSKEALRLYADTIKRINFSDDGKVAYLINDHNDPALLQEKLGIAKHEVKDVFSKVNEIIMRNIEGVKVAASLNKQNNQTVTSLRSNNIVVNELAKRFGGGGHDYAAGFHMVNKSPEEIVDIIDKEVKKQEN